jgi:hypothetical protein
MKNDFCGPIMGIGIYSRAQCAHITLEIQK